MMTHQREGPRTMGCLFVLLTAVSPRLAIFLFWLARPLQFDVAFGGPILPLLGIVFLPYTTLLYAVVYTPGQGLVGWDWIWVGFAVFADIAHTAAVATDKRYNSGF